MRIIVLSLILLASCSKTVEYDLRKVVPLADPTNIVGPPNGPTNQPIKTIGGSLPPGLTISVHKVNGCSDVALASGSSQNFLANLTYTLPQGYYDIYLRVSNGVASRCTGPYRNYLVDTTPPQITLHPTISPTPTDYNRTYHVKGTVSDNNGIPVLSFHKNNLCVDAPAFPNSQNNYNAAGLTLDSTLIDNLSTSFIYAKVKDVANNQICQLLVTYTHITGPATADNSYFEIEKTLITPKFPVQSNNITFTARDLNNNPVNGLSPDLTITPEVTVPFTCAMPATMVSGQYQCVVSLSESYDIDITPGSITFFTDRSVGSVVVTDNAYCYQNGGLAWTDHKQTGDGTTATPYLICSAAQLKSLAETITPADLSQEYKLMVDLNLESFLTTATNEFSIGSGAVAFSGVFDGSNLKIENYKPKLNNQGFIQSMSAGTIKNLEFSYKTGVVATSLTMSPFIGVISTTANVVLDKLKVKGDITCDSVTACNVGGVIGLAEATGAGQINMTSLQSELLATNVSGSVGGVIRTATSPSASKIVLTEINSVLSVSHSGAGSLTLIGGVIASSTGATLKNIKSNLSVDIDAAPVQSLGGIIGASNSTLVDDSLVLGFTSVQDINSIAGISGRITNFSSVTDSVSLMNISGVNCLVECGKVVGQQNSLDNTMTALYTSDQTQFDFDTVADQNFTETSINLVTTPGYFYAATNAPMNGWDFTNHWMEVVNNFPELLITNP